MRTPRFEDEWSCTGRSVLILPRALRTLPNVIHRPRLVPCRVPEMLALRTVKVERAQAIRRAARRCGQ